ncbi:MAG: ABC transporter substrate-binding protein [Chloroflexi bacterium]|nr:ABC transporter substrate-binding protein [Chloroflexota bacterium]
MAKRTALVAMLALTLLACSTATQPTATPLTQPSTTATATATAVVARPAATTAPTPTPKPTPKPTAAPTVASQTGGPKSGGILRHSLRGDPQMDAWARVNWDIYEVAAHVHPRLARISSTSEPCATSPKEPELATGWKWLDDTTLEVTLRQGVRFAPGAPFNGREFTADDLYYTATVQWPRSPVFTTVAARLKGVEKVDKYTVRFTLKEVFADFVEAIVENRRLPVAGPELFGPDKAVPGIVQAGLGPFRIAKYTPGVAVDFEKNPNYWRKGIPYLDGLKGLIMPDFSMVAAAIRAGKLDFAEMFGVMPVSQSLKQSNPDLQFAWCPATSPNAFYLPNDEAPFDNVQVRRAIAMALDRQAILKVNWGDNAMASYGIVGPGLDDIVLNKEDYPPEVRQYLEYHPDRARTLLAQAGYPQGFEMVVSAQARRRDRVVTAETISRMLGDVGIKVTLNIPDDPAFLATVRQGRYTGGMIYPLSDASNTELLNWVSTNPPSINYGRIKDQEYDALVSEFQRTLDPQKRKDIARRMQIRSVDQVLAIPFGVAKDANIRQPWVKGIPPKFSSFVPGDYVMYAWLDR